MTDKKPDGNNPQEIDGVLLNRKFLELFNRTFNHGRPLKKTLSYRQLDKLSTAVGGGLREAFKKAFLADVINTDTKTIKLEYEAKEIFMSVSELNSISVHRNIDDERHDLAQRFKEWYGKQYPNSHRHNIKAYNIKVGDLIDYILINGKEVPKLVGISSINLRVSEFNQPQINLFNSLFPKNI